MTYNMSAFESSNNIAQQYVAMNTIVPFFTPIVLVVIFVVFTLLFLRRNPLQESVAGASGVTGVAAVIFLAMGVIDVVYVIGAAVVFGVAAIALYLKS